jgi:serpin B
VEAAAFTELHYAGSAPPKDEKAEMILNRPFIFAIKDNTGNVLFVGIVNNPHEK